MNKHGKYEGGISQVNELCLNLPKPSLQTYGKLDAVDSTAPLLDVALPHTPDRPRVAGTAAQPLRAAILFRKRTIHTFPRARFRVREGRR
jgi:hypothetical protein